MHVMPSTLIRYYLINVKAKAVTSLNHYAMNNYRRADIAVRLPKCGISIDLNDEPY